MYHAHFGLERSLFGDGIATDAAVFRSAKHDRLIAHFKLALASPSSGIVLHGAAGVGKTTLTSTALRAISTRLALAWIGGMATNSAELLELLLVELGVSTLRTTRMERLQLWRQFQSEMHATDSRLIVVVERTEDVPPDVLHALDQLTAPDAVGNPGANFVLLGHGSIYEHLAAPVLDSLRQRIRLRTELEPFTEAELQEYLRQQVAAAGGQYDRLFAAGAVAALHRYSQGVARLANTLCESALDIAAIQQQKQLTGELVAKTAVTLLGLAEPAAPPAAAPARAVAPAVETRPAPRPAATTAPTAPIFERRAEPRIPAPAASALPTEARPAPPPAPPASVAAPPPPPAGEIEFDGGATDVADVALADFPILTDAVDALAEPPLAKPAAPPSAKAAPQAPSAPPAARAAPPAVQAPSAPAQVKPASPPAAGVAARPPAKPAARVEPSSSPPRPAPKPTPAAPVAPTTTPLPHAAAAAAAKPRAGAARDAKANDALRPPQTARGIAEAKSIDELSDLDAETLFGDAELDLVSAALASAEWPDDDEVAPAKPAPARSTAATPTQARAAAPPAKPPKPPEPAEDAFDLFGLDDNAPLELIDDSTLPPASPRKTASR
jgi:general secretion pathway protein A